MCIRGVRGANVVTGNSIDEILKATQILLEAICAANVSLRSEDIASILFTVTDDLDAVHPALAARQMGWVDVPMLCAKEIPVPGSMKHCIRVLMHWNTDLPQSQVHHIYLGAAASLRPDIQIPAISTQLSTK